MDVKSRIDEIVTQRKNQINHAILARADAMQRVEQEYQEVVSAASTRCEKEIAEVINESFCVKEATGVHGNPVQEEVSRKIN